MGEKREKLKREIKHVLRTDKGCDQISAGVYVTCGCVCVYSVFDACSKHFQCYCFVKWPLHLHVSQRHFITPSLKTDVISAAMDGSTGGWKDFMGFQENTKLGKTSLLDGLTVRDENRN